MSAGFLIFFGRVFFSVNVGEKVLVCFVVFDFRFALRFLRKDEI